MIVPTAASVDLAADAHNASVAAGVPSSDIEENLYPALVECFGIIFMGYVAGRFNIVSSAECKGMATFVSNFALPALVFGSLCRLDFSVVNWTFLLAIFIAKSALFFAVLLVALVALRPTDPARAGLYAIFTTQSNDFALGFPILTAIYGKTNPEFPMYLYLIAPINLVILNPIGFICMEVGNRRSDGHTAGVDVSNARHCFNVARSIASNPIIAMTLAGILGNFVFSSSPPALLEQFLSTMGSAFSASALFLLGVQIVGNRAVKRRSSGSSFLLPFILVTLKSVALPIVAREVISQISTAPANETEHLANFAFLYGTFPVAPSVFVFAAKYNVEPVLTANAMVFSTAVAAPIMYISAKLLSITDINPADYIHELDRFLLDVSILCLLAAIWVVFVFAMTKKTLRAPYFVTTILVVSQGIACIGAILWSQVSCTHGWKLYVQFGFVSFGVYSSRINTAILAIVVFLAQTNTADVVARYKRTFVVVGVAAPALLVASLMVIVADETPKHADKTDPNFQYGTTQAVVALIVLILSFLTTVVFMILTQRYRRRRRRWVMLSVPIPGTGREEFAPLLNPVNTGDDTEAEEETRLLGRSSSVRSPEEMTVPIEDLMRRRPAMNSAGGCLADNNPNGARRYRCDSEHREYCSSLINCYNVPPAEDAVEVTVSSGGTASEGCQRREDEDEQQTLRHLMLLVMLTISMFIGISLCVWTLVMDSMTGIYLELVFLDGFLNFGQALFSLALFGFDDNYVALPIRRAYRKLIYGVDSLILPSWEDLGPETKSLCEQFIKHHVSKCMEVVLKDIRVRLTNHRAVFRGGELVDWLLEVGLARDRSGGVEYGRSLIKGRVIRHVDNHLDFYDDAFLYTFAPVQRERTESEDR